MTVRKSSTLPDANLSPEFIAQCYARISAPFAVIDRRLSLSERFRLIRHNYAVQQNMVDSGLCSWHRSDVYRIANWVTLFTPIESMAWCDIRAAGIPFWPQFPVGRYFVDFGDPVHKVALECDGAAYHNAEKDRKRDEELALMGWRVYRASGAVCVRDEDSDERECLIDILHGIARLYYPELPIAQSSPRHCRDRDHEFL